MCKNTLAISNRLSVRAGGKYVLYLTYSGGFWFVAKPVRRKSGLYKDLKCHQFCMLFSLWTFELILSGVYTVTTCFEECYVRRAGFQQCFHFLVESKYNIE